MSSPVRCRPFRWSAGRVSTWRNMISTTTASTHAAVQQSAASARPRFRSRHAATTTSRNDRTTCPGSVTIWATPTPTGWNGAWSRGTSDSRNVGGGTGCPASGMACSAAQLSRRVVAPEPTRPASAANAAAAATALLRRGGHPQPQRRRDDLEACGGRPDRLAVDLERQLLGGIDRDARGPQELDLRVREIAAAVQLRRGRDEVELRDVADQHDVEGAVVLPGVGRELHPPAVEAAVRDDHVVHGALPPEAVVELDDYARVLPRQELARECVEERRPATEPLRHRVRTPRHGAAHSGRADIGEEPARAVLELDASEVDPPHRAGERDADCVVEATRDTVRAAEVLTRAARQDGDLRIRPGGPVHDLVHRAVAADHHEQRVTRFACRLREMSRELREHLVAAQAEVGRPLPQLRPALPGRAVAGGRVDEEEDSANRR